MSVFNISTSTEISCEFPHFQSTAATLFTITFSNLPPHWIAVVS